MQHAYLLVQRLIEQGGFVMGLLFICSLILWSLIIERYLFIYRSYPSFSRGLLANGRMQLKTTHWGEQSVKAMLSSQLNSALERYQSSIKSLIALCPLLGLLGTVSGMIHVFDVISLTGNSDAKAMAAGIYQATIPTMAGLMLALSAMLFSHRLHRKSQQLSQHFASELNKERTL